jgi:hypothetical protein
MVSTQTQTAKHEDRFGSGATDVGCRGECSGLTIGAGGAILARMGTGFVGRARIIGLSVATAWILCVASVSAAAQVHVSGALSGTKLPAGGAGAAVVQAMNLADGSIAAAQVLDPSGRFSLKLRPGPYALLAGSVFFRSGLPTLKLVGAVGIRAGRSRRLPLSLKRVRAHDAGTGVGTAASAASDPSLSRRVGVMTFTGAAAFQNAGLADMVVTDLVPLSNGPPCAFSVIEMQHRDDIIKEIKLQQTEFFDPASRIKPGHLLQPNLVVNGSLTASGGGAVGYVLRVVNARNGRVKGTVVGTISPDEWLTASSDIARRLADIICQPDDDYFRIVGYTRTERSTSDYGEHTITDSLSGGTGPVTKVAECTDPIGCAADFQVDATVTTTANGHVFGVPDNGCPGGAYTYPTQTLQNPVHLDIMFDPDWVKPATASEAMIPYVGDVTSDICGANDSSDPVTVSTSVSADDLLSGDPVTFTFTSSGSALSTEGDHPGTVISWSLSESITIQRVQANGSPL